MIIVVVVIIIIIIIIMIIIIIIIMIIIWMKALFCITYPQADKLYCEEVDVGEAAARNIASGE